jgi:hypothetical protein
MGCPHTYVVFVLMSCACACAAQAVKEARHRFVNGHIADAEERAKLTLAKHQQEDPRGCYTWLEPRPCEHGDGMTGAVALILVRSRV